MSVGLPLDKANIDNKASGIVLAVRDSLEAASRFCDLLNDTGIVANDAALTGMGYTQSEVNTLRAAFTALQNLRNIARGTRTQASVNDFFFDAKKLTGAVV